VAAGVGFSGSGTGCHDDGGTGYRDGQNNDGSPYFSHDDFFPVNDLVARRDGVPESMMWSGFYIVIRRQHPHDNHDLRRVCKDFIKMDGVTVLWMDALYSVAWK
jgi:hypothetical protein